VRHAESVENERLAALKQFGNDLYEFKVPFWTDFSKGAGLLAVPDPIDTPLSDSGIAQVEQVADKLHQDSFFQTREIDLVVHSPLSRAKDTCLGLVREESIEIQEWDCLREKFVSEWIPGNGVGLDIRIQEFENRLLQLPHKNIVSVFLLFIIKHLTSIIVCGWTLSVFQKNVEDGK